MTTFVCLLLTVKVILLPYKTIIPCGPYQHYYINHFAEREPYIPQLHHKSFVPLRPTTLLMSHQAAMEEAIKANGGIVTKGGFKHTTYGVVGPGWRVTPSWKKNGVQVLDEGGFWELLERKKWEREVKRGG